MKLHLKWTSWPAQTFSLFRLKWTSFLLMDSLCVNLYLILYMNSISITSYYNLDTIMSKFIVETSVTQSSMFVFNTTAKQTKAPSHNETHSNVIHDLASYLAAQVPLNSSAVLATAERTSNIASQYWARWTQIDAKQSKNLHKSKVAYCESVQLPHPLDLKYNNIHWQRFDPSRVAPHTGPIYLLNAYYDNRIESAPLVKLITVSTTDRENRRINWCLLWFENIKAPVLVEASYYSLMDYQQAQYHSQIITCPVPAQHLSDIPQAVSLQAKCDWMSNQVETVPSNVLRVIFNPRSNASVPHSIGVCVQAFRFGSNDVSVRLVEWLETVKLLGADKVYFYMYDATENMKQVIRHYEKQVWAFIYEQLHKHISMQGLVQTRPLTLPGEQPNLSPLYNQYYRRIITHFWPQELIELNDCLYRNLYQHDYLAIIDIDEIIMPQQANNWHQLIKQIENKTKHHNVTYSSYLSRHAHVCDVFREREFEGKPIPDYLYMMQHTYRSEPLIPKNQPKCIHRTDLVSAVHNHVQLMCKGNVPCHEYHMEPNEEAVLWHYRQNQTWPERVYLNDHCPIHERPAWRYYKALQESVPKQLQAIFSPND